MFFRDRQLPISSHFSFYLFCCAPCLAHSESRRAILRLRRLARELLGASRSRRPHMDEEGGRNTFRHADPRSRAFQSPNGVPARAHVAITPVPEAGFPQTRNAQSPRRAGPGLLRAIGRTIPSRGLARAARRATLRRRLRGLGTSFPGIVLLAHHCFRKLLNLDDDGSSSLLLS